MYKSSNQEIDESEYDDFSDEEKISSYIRILIDDSESHLDQQEKSRTESLEYYDGVMTDVKHIEGRSKITSKDIRANVKKIMPSIMRSFFGNGRIVDYSPVVEGTEEQAVQASDYVNNFLYKDCNMFNAIYDAIFDALLVKTGILKVCVYKDKSRSVNNFFNKTEEDLIGISEDEDYNVEITNDYVDESGQKRIDYKVIYEKETVKFSFECVPRGHFLIHPSSEDIKESPVVGERKLMTRSELVQKGYDKDQVYSLPVYSSNYKGNNDEQARKGEDYSDQSSQIRTKTRSMQMIQVYELYIPMDIDGDGIAELYRVVCSEGATDDDRQNSQYEILAMDEVDEAPYFKIVAEREPHNFEGHSVAEDLSDIQRIKTALLRNSLDNIYWQNNQQVAYDRTQLTEAGLEAVINPEFGKPIELKRSADVNKALQFINIPFIADKTFVIMDKLDKEAKERTGITDSSSSLDPDVFKNMTATTSRIAIQPSVDQAEMMITFLSTGGLEDAFRYLLKLVILNSDSRITKRISGEWVEFNISDWDIGFTCRVNVGLGTGNREIDLNIAQNIFAMQEKILTSLGPDNPYVKPMQVYNSIKDIAESMSVKNVDNYFTRPNEQEIQQKLANPPPSPEQLKYENEIKKEQIKADVNRQKESFQMQADLVTRQADEKIRMIELAHAKEIDYLKAQLDLYKHNTKLDLEYEKLNKQSQQQVDDLGAFDENR